LTEPALQATGLGKDFRDGARALTVLDGLDLSVAPGETVAIVGRSGCGKTTLLQCLGLLDRPTRGSVRLAGRDAAGWTRRRRDAWRASRAGFVFQHYPLLDDFSALENVQLALRLAGRAPSEARRIASLWIGRVGLADRARHRPPRLSGGERQRCAIARAMAPVPDILFCDEPTGSLDAETGRRTAALFRELARQERTAVLWVTHDRDWALGADRVLSLEGGRLAPWQP